MIDIGANLTHASFERDLPAVLQRAADAGVTAMIVTGADHESSAHAFRLAAKHPQLYATAGCHPHEAAHFSDDHLRLFNQWALDERVLALGEMGLDFNRDYSPRQIQLDVFEAQLDNAADSGLPVFLHQRDAVDPFLDLLKKYRDRLNGAVWHCFTGTLGDLHRARDLDLHIGVTGWVCDERRGASVVEALPHIPADRLMLETDAPYLLPRTLRPKPAHRRNEPAYLAHIAEQVARLRHVDPEQLLMQVAATTRTFFQLPD